MSEAFHSRKRSVCHYFSYFYPSPDFQQVGKSLNLMADPFIKHNLSNSGVCRLAQKLCCFFFLHLFDNAYLKKRLVNQNKSQTKNVNSNINQKYESLSANFLLTNGATYLGQMVPHIYRWDQCSLNAELYNMMKSPLEGSNF